ncbi:MAG: CheR family methyltransferase [Phenylobacterium sp.]|nr:CheR family methyltransferase [Phenylobacterium sp.]
MRPSRTAPPLVFGPDHPFWRIKRAVIETTGHFYYIDKDDLLLERLRRRQAACRDPDLGSYLARLNDPVAGPEEWRSLEAEISIGETFFFRYADQFTALRNTILPDLLARRDGEKRLRVLSAGCSTGAEPYSIAIVLDELLGLRRPDWRISILGADLNESALETARRGVYTSWALRSLTPDQRRAWFTEADGRWTLRPRYRGSVRFERRNLLDLLGPAPPLELSDFDLILCRNVLIYFHPDQVTAVSEALVGRLRPDGWLLVGHAESGPDFARFARAELVDDTVAYRPLTGAPSPPPRSATSAPTDWLPHPWPATVAPPPLAPSRLAPPAKAPVAESRVAALPVTTAEAAVDEVRTLADRGDLAAALEAGRRALTDHPREPALHYYLGLAEHALGDLVAAEASLRRALYLEPTFIMAHYQLGVTRLAQGRDLQARRSIHTAASLSATQSPDMRLPHGASLTVADLRDLVRLQHRATDIGGAT